MMNEHKTVSIADQIFEQLEKEILTGEYERGEVLTEAKLSEKLGVSRTPIREALRRLAQEHIIVETTRGASVIGINKEDMRDMYDIRMRLEGFAAYKAAQNRTDEDVEKEYTDLAEKYGMDVENVKKYLTRDVVEDQVKSRKAIAIVTDSAVATAPVEEEKPAKKTAARKSAKKAEEKSEETEESK